MMKFHDLDQDTKIRVAGIKLLGEAAGGSFHIYSGAIDELQSDLDIDYDAALFLTNEVKVTLEWEPPAEAARLEVE